MTEAYSTYPYIEEEVERKTALNHVMEWMKQHHRYSKVAREAETLIEQTTDGLDVSGWEPITAPKSVVFKCIREAIRHTAPELKP